MIFMLMGILSISASSADTNTMNCTICFNPYNDIEDSRRPCIGTCGHTLCLSCKNAMPNVTCPFCKANEAFAVTTFNYTLLDLIPREPSASASSKQAAVQQGLGECPSCLHEKIMASCGIEEARDNPKKLRFCLECGEKDGHLDVQRNERGKITSYSIKYDPGNPQVIIDNFIAVKSSAVCATCICENSITNEFAKRHQGHRTYDLANLEREFMTEKIKNDFSDEAVSRFEFVVNATARLPHMLASGYKRIAEELGNCGQDKLEKQETVAKHANERIDAISQEIGKLKTSIGDLVESLQDDFEIPVDAQTLEGPALLNSHDIIDATIREAMASYQRLFPDSTGVPPKVTEILENIRIRDNNQDIEMEVEVDPRLAFTAEGSSCNPNIVDTFIQDVQDTTKQVEGMEVNVEMPSTSAELLTKSQREYNTVPSMIDPSPVLPSKPVTSTAFSKKVPVIGATGVVFDMQSFMPPPAALATSSTVSSTAHKSTFTTPNGEEVPIENVYDRVFDMSALLPPPAAPTATNPLSSEAHPAAEAQPELPHLAFENTILVADQDQTKATMNIIIGEVNARDGSYKEIGQLPDSRNSFATARTDTLLFIVGGALENTSAIASVLAYNRNGGDSLQNFVIADSQMLVARKNASAAVYNNKLYVVGGRANGGDYLKSVEVLDFNGGNVFAEAPALNHERADATLAVVGDKMYAIGGSNGLNCEAWIEVFDGNAWTDLCVMNAVNAGSAATVFGNKIYIAGGGYTGASATNSVIIFDPTTRTWAPGKQMIHGRRKPILATIAKDGRDDHILAIRGYGIYLNLCTVNEKFDPSAQTPGWEEIRAPAVAKDVTRAAHAESGIAMEMH